MIDNMGLCGSSNVKYRINNPVSEITCPEGALIVQPGLNSLSKAVKEAKEKDIDCLFLLNGMHDEKGGDVEIDCALKVVGQNKDDVKIRAGLENTGEEEDDLFLSDCTVTGAKGTGVFGVEDASMHLKNVCVEKCGGHGVVSSTLRNTMTDCNVNNNAGVGVFLRDGGCMIIDGSATTIHHNVTATTSHLIVDDVWVKRRENSDSYGNSHSYGLKAYSGIDSIHLKSPLTKESISTNNGGGGNYGGCGTIKTI